MKTAIIMPSCRHLSGYWIKRGETFRCYRCGYQFRLSDLAPFKRNIETWKTE
jgi:tRNA(Ile2) C34 agmatinyltransferase TiaS